MPSPPRLARWLVERLIVPADRDAALGDLCEEFEVRVRTSRASARAWFWMQVIRSIIPSIRRRWPASILPSPQGARLESLWQDLRFSSRLVRHRPTVSLVAVASLTAGMSLVCIVFVLLNAIVIRPLPVRAPQELVVLREQRPTGINHNFSYQDFVDYRASQQTMVDMVASSQMRVSTRAGNATEIVNGEFVSGSYFRTLGVPVSFGRSIEDNDDRPGQPPVAVVSERLWRQWGRALPLQASESVALNGTEFVVVGLVANGFSGLQTGRRSDIWIAAAHQPVIAAVSGRAPVPLTRGLRWLDVFGRRKPGVVDDVVVADLNRVEAGVAASLGLDQPRKLFVEDGSHGIESAAASAAPTLRVLFAAAVVVLLVACANVANLLMARVTERRRELSMRIALGAGRLRLVRLLFVEALVLGGASALAALFLSNLGAAFAVSFLTSLGDRLVLNLGIDWRIGLFVSGLGLTATIVSSLAPALHILKDASAGQLVEGGRAVTAGRFARRVRSTLLVSQFALSLVLVVTALLLARTVFKLRHTPTGYAINEVALLSVSPRAALYNQARASAYMAAVAQRLRQEPGVLSVGFARIPPVNFGGSRTTLMVPGYVPQAGEDMEINYNEVSGDYFDALGIPIRDGEPFRDAARQGGPTPAVINDTMARRYWPAGRAVGQPFHLGEDHTAPVAEVVAVVGDAKYRTIREEAGPSFYMPLSTQQVRDGSWHVRVAGDPEAALPALRRALTDVDPQVPITSALTLRRQQSMNITDDRLAMTIGITLASAALLLAGVGLFGAMSQLVGQRTREIGVRLALGASPPGIGRLVLGQAMGIALAGSALGLVIALWATSLTAARLFGVDRFDLISFVGAAAVLTAVAIASALIPARRAACVDPVCALRHD